MMTCSDLDSIPTSLPCSKVTVGGDAIIDPSVTECYRDDVGIFRVPVIMNKSNPKDSYEITIQIDMDNVEATVKPVTAYLVMGYWGCYPCQLDGSSVTPLFTQILEMTGKNTIMGERPDSVDIVFALNEDDWNREVSRNHVEGEDADFRESGCGYTFILTCYDNTKIGDITNRVGFLQNAAFNPFVITIRGIEYVGLVSKNCELPSGDPVGGKYVAQLVDAD